VLWGNDPLGHSILGSEEVISKIERDAIAAYKERYYVPRNMVVSVAGNITHQSVLQQVESLFADLPGGEVKGAPGLTEADQPARALPYPKDTNQTHFIIGALGYEYDHPQEAASRVMTNILGQGMSSRLFINVRERKGLAYTVYASSQRFVDTGAFEVYAGVNTDKASQAIEAVIEELTLIRNQPVTSAELSKAKNQLKAGLMMGMESNSGVAMRQGRHLTLLNKLKTPEESLREIDAVSVDDVQKVAREVIASQNLRLAIIAPQPEAAVDKFSSLVGAN
jgi:predicted Zn-dependent peptidase